MTAQLLSYKPERKRYERKADDYVVGMVNKAIAPKMVAQALTTLGDDVRNANAERDDMIDYMLDLFRGRHDLGIPADKRHVHFDAKSAKPADIIFRVMGMLMAPLKFQYIPPDGSDRDSDADAIEAHLNALYPWMARRYQTRWDIQSLFWTLVAGRSYVQQSHLPHYWDKTVMRQRKDEPDGEYNGRVAGYRGYMGPPFLAECLDPRTTWEIRTPQGVDAWVKMYRVERFELDAAFGRIGKKPVYDVQGRIQGVTEEDKQPGQPLPIQTDAAKAGSLVYYEYIDDVMVYYVCEGRVIHSYQHNGGIRIFPAYCLQTGLKENNMDAVGILWAVRNEIPQLDFLRTIWLQMAYLTANPHLFAILGETDDPIRDESGNPREWDLSPGKITQIRGQLVNALKDAGAGVDFRAFVEMITADVDMATISPLARGYGGAQQPGYSINQLAQAMRLLWKPAIESIELQRSMMAEHYLWCQRNIVKQDMSIFAEVNEGEGPRRTGKYFTLKKDSVPEFFRVQAILDPDIPIDKQGQMITGANLHREGMITWEEMTREFFGKTNPESRRRQVYIDMAERAWLPKALEDAMALGRIQVSQEVLEAAGLDKLNSIGNMDIRALAEARKTASPDTAGGGPGGGGVDQPAGHPGGPGPGPTPPGTPEGGGLVAQVAGANPANPNPGPRG